MNRAVLIMLIFILTLSVLSAPVSAAGGSEAAEPADTGDLFGLIIAALLTSAMALAALIAHKTRFIHEDCKKKAGG